jgi:hypothetical protein
MIYARRERRESGKGRPADWAESRRAPSCSQKGFQALLQTVIYAAWTFPREDPGE